MLIYIKKTSIFTLIILLNKLYCLICNYYGEVNVYNIDFKFNDSLI